MHSTPVFDEFSPLEMRDALGGTPAPCVRDSPFEVADVILVLRDCDLSVADAARELNLSSTQVYACLECHRRYPEAVDARIQACDFRIGLQVEAGLPVPHEVDERTRWDWRLAPA